MIFKLYHFTQTIQINSDMRRIDPPRRIIDSNLGRGRKSGSWLEKSHADAVAPFQGVKLNNLQSSRIEF